jgi:hypothetical protein
VGEEVNEVSAPSDQDLLIVNLELPAAGEYEAQLKAAKEKKARFSS